MPLWPSPIAEIEPYLKEGFRYIDEFIDHYLHHILLFSQQKANPRACESGSAAAASRSLAAATMRCSTSASALWALLLGLDMVNSEESAMGPHARAEHLPPCPRQRARNAQIV